MNQIQLNNDDMFALVEKIMMLMDENEYSLALDLLNSGIEALIPDILLLRLRASAHSALLNWDEAIDDLNEAVRLNADDPANHLTLGAYRTQQLFGSNPHRFKGHHPVLQQSLAHYTDCLALDPANQSAWLNLAETHLFLHQWDFAIAAYGDSRAYMTDRQHQVTRSWIGCLALVFSGDPVYDEDKQHLYDQSIRFEAGSHDTRQVDILLDELADDGFDHNKLAQARVIHDEFLRHFDS